MQIDHVSSSTKKKRINYRKARAAVKARYLSGIVVCNLIGTLASFAEYLLTAKEPRYRIVVSRHLRGEWETPPPSRHIRWVREDALTTTDAFTVTLQSYL